MEEKRIKTIGIKAAAYDILKKVSEERKNSVKPDGIIDIATEAIVKTYGENLNESETSGGSDEMDA